MDSEASTPSNIDDLESEVYSAIFRCKLDLLQDMAQHLKVEKQSFNENLSQLLQNFSVDKSVNS